MHLFTIEGVYAFAASSEVKPRPRGLVRETVRIPANFLNDGTYSVTIQFVQDSTSVYVHPEILVFEVLDSMREGNWFGKWPGVIRPKLEWVSRNL
jgi:lipopolysaccharide transport system ATP-binding protein